MCPCVVSASKSGAISLMRRLMFHLSCGVAHFVCWGNSLQNQSPPGVRSGWALSDSRIFLGPQANTRAVRQQQQQQRQMRISEEPAIAFSLELRSAACQRQHAASLRAWANLAPPTLSISPANL